MSNILSRKIPTAKHSPEQMAYDRDHWREQLNKYQGRNHPREEPGDMCHRGIWTFEPGSTFNYVPYSQMSCAVGQANVYSTADLDRVVTIARQFGKLFLFTAVKQNLLEAIRKRPDDFQLLAEGQSWMGGECPVYLYMVKV